MTTFQFKTYTEAKCSEYEKDRQPSVSDILRQFSVSLGSETDEQDGSVENVKQLFSSYNSATEWMHTHNSDVILALDLLHIYPNLIQKNVARPLLRLLKPLLNSVPQRCLDNKQDVPEPSSVARKVVYVCGHSELVTDGVTAKDRIIASLSCYCRVQTHPDPPPQDEHLQDALDDIKSSDVCILFLSDDTLNCWFTLYKLAGAVNLNIPIITIRDSSFELSEPLPESFYQTEIITDQISGLRIDVLNAESRRENRLLSSTSSGFHSASSKTENYDSREQIPSDFCLLADVVKTCYLSSMKYVSKFHDSCVAKLFGKLSDYLGDFFLDLEISNHFGRSSPEADADKVSVYFTKSGILRKQPNQHYQRQGYLRAASSNLISNSMTPNSDKYSQNDVYKMDKEQSHDIKDDLSNLCESPFVHRTNYVVFPSRSPSSARKSPYLVSFPEGIDSVEKEDFGNDSPYGDFDNVRLDVTAPFKESPPPSPNETIKPVDKKNENDNSKTNIDKDPQVKEKEMEIIKESSQANKDGSNMSELRVQKKEQKPSSVTRDSSALPNSKKTASRKTAKLPKINLQVHDVRVMKKHKSKRLGKSVSL